MLRKMHSISQLPLPPSSSLLIHNLTPDPITSSIAEFRNVLANNPSMQRRSRILKANSHFSYVSPFPVHFPYNIDVDETVKDKGVVIEKWLAEREAIHEPSSTSGTLKKYFPKIRDNSKMELIGLSQTGLNDCIPHLNVGDAFTLLGTPSLTAQTEESDPKPSTNEADVAARIDLVDVLSGRTMIISDEFAPWSLRYSGHQFGDWVGQLGDGRAISIMITPHPTHPDVTYELQLKGAGRTPFSRFADGLAVQRSSIREFLGSEAMHALGIPTTRSLSLISLPSVHVLRERVEFASVMTRMAPSFIRIGSFEALNPPSSFSGQQAPDLEALRLLGEWVSRKVLKIESEKWAKELVMECARRNAIMVAGWQAYGFMHGVMNTDNISIMGLTMDYGPYAFMDVFDRLQICNESDEGGRYSYRAQPSMIVYALRSLLKSLAPAIGAEEELGKAILQGWAESKEKVDEWKKKGLELVSDEIEQVIQQTMSDEYGRLMHKRLGLKRLDPTDESDISRPLLDLMENHKVDFHSTFRSLCYFSPSSNTEEFADMIASRATDAYLVRDSAKREWTAWLNAYKRRIESESLQWESFEIRQQAMLSANPRFVLRQWVLEEVIEKTSRDVAGGKRMLAKVLHMACLPFEKWGAEGEEPEDEEQQAERRLCGLGDPSMLGFQCSCSS